MGFSYKHTGFLNWRRYLCIFIAVFYVAFGFFMPVVSAETYKPATLPESELKAIDNYPEWVAHICSNESSGAQEITGNSRAEVAFKFFVSMGLKPFQAAGIVGNMQHESGIDPENIENAYGGRSKDPADAGSHGWGIVQWTPANTKVPGIAEAAGIKEPVYELTTQLDMLWAQLDGKAGGYSEKQAGDDIKSSKDVEDATRAFQGDDKIGGKYHGFERPYSESASLATRIAKARIYLKQFGDGASDGVSIDTDPSTGICSDDSGGASDGSEAALQSTVKRYAWPDYHPANFTTTKEAYALAISKARKAGHYVGGISLPGIDCGGFITTAMIDSGYEPRYNFDGKGGPTGTQWDWLKKNWQEIHPDTTNDLKTGDVAINDHHTYMYVGKIKDFNSVIASASLDERAPMAGHEAPADKSFSWYRKK